jgi:hypothetical protein
VFTVYVTFCLIETGERGRDGSDPQKHPVMGKWLTSSIDDNRLVRLVMNHPDDYPSTVQAIRKRRPRSGRPNHTADSKCADAL